MKGNQLLLRRRLDITLLGVMLLSIIMPSVVVTADDGNGNDSDVSISGSFTIIATTKQVDIDIIPFKSCNVIVIRSWGLIPVAILSSPDFYAPTDVEKTSLTFGHTGDEQSLAFCFPWAWDVNHDGLRDQTCFFRTRLTGFETGDTEGILRGRQSPIFLLRGEIL